MALHNIVRRFWWRLLQLKFQLMFTDASVEYIFAIRRLATRIDQHPIRQVEKELRANLSDERAPDGMAGIRACNLSDEDWAREWDWWLRMAQNYRCGQRPTWSDFEEYFDIHNSFYNGLTQS